MDKNKKSSILSKYKKESNEIILSMMKVLMRASKKTDNSHYQEIVDRLNKEI